MEQRSVLENDAAIDGIVFPAGSEIWLSPEGHVEAVTLSRNTAVLGIPLAGDFLVEFYVEGGVPRIKRAPLSAQHRFGEFNCAPGFDVTFYPDGQVATVTIVERLSRDGVDWPAGTMLVLNRRGRVVKAQLGSSASVQGLPCAANSIVELDGDGSVSLAELGQETTIDGVSYSAGTVLSIDPAGRVFSTSRAR